MLDRVIYPKEDNSKLSVNKIIRFIKTVSLSDIKNFISATNFIAD